MLRFGCRKSTVKRSRPGTVLDGGKVSMIPTVMRASVRASAAHTTRATHRPARELDPPHLHRRGAGVGFLSEHHDFMAAHVLNAGDDADGLGPLLE